MSSTVARKPTNVTLPGELLRDARALGINVSQACERGVAAEVAAVRRERWLTENGEAIKEYDAQVAERGMTLQAYRRF